ncbi:MULTISPECIES: hypothetical protein [unclassified Coleofasciculus]|uniref:hypothetical protein n=1 Tax=unclassified Coleofasciculus TaxID=2692782 RepID=UPI0018823114|nr:MULTISPECIES: hypothetical protein [unclassified Coleofasciculus]MBE9125125.1 hypothetical protein [Coleofasciculus sp. LEGE 07081]MBE9148342.1 hypothetical protein [Coleofasciculus sp. LEGE 07092]
MPRTPDEYAVHILLSGGHREEVRFATIQEFQKWYSGELMPKATSPDFISVPIKNIQGEYMVLRPSGVLAIRVEPIFAGSVERF